MSDSAVLKEQHAEDCALTLPNRARLSANRNLLHRYGELYRHQFQDYRDPQRLKILEIGSRVSPFQRFYPNVITRDVLDLDYLDYLFDCHPSTSSTKLRTGAWT
jgi:hypothetical protein